MKNANDKGGSHSGSTGTPAPITCEQVTALVVDYVTGTLDDTTAGAFERHLQRCRDCIAFLNTYQKTIQTTQSLSYDDIPAEMVQRVQQLLSQRLGLHRPHQ